VRLPARRASFVSFVCGLLSLLLCPRWANADSRLKVEAVPILGANSPSVDGWGEVYVRLENSGLVPFNGYVELRSAQLGRGALRALSRAPFSIAPKSRVSLLLPSHGLVHRPGDTKVVAVDAQGGLLSEDQLQPVRSLDPLLFDLHSPSRLAPVLNTQPVPIRRRGGWRDIMRSVPPLPWPPRLRAPAPPASPRAAWGSTGPAAAGAAGAR